MRLVWALAAPDRKPRDSGNTARVLISPFQPIENPVRLSLLVAAPVQVPAQTSQPGRPHHVPDPVGSLQKILDGFVELLPIHLVQFSLLGAAAVGNDLLLHVE